MLTDLTPCVPFTIGGIKDGVKVTHSGKLRFLPGPLALCYYAPASQVNLVSLGFLRRRKALYTTPNEPDFPLYLHYNNHLLSRAPMAPNNLHPIPSSTLLCNFSHVDVQGNQTNRSYSNPSSFSYINEHINPTKHFTPEQRSRASQYRDLHFTFCHPNDRKLCIALDHGRIPNCHLTSADYKTYLAIYGTCPQCTTVKIKRKSMIASTSPPATACAQTLSIDVNRLITTSPGGNTHEIVSVDEFTGNLEIAGCKSKQSPDLLFAILDIIGRYRIHGHYVKNIHCDSESCLLALRIPLSNLDHPITLTASPLANTANALNATFKHSTIESKPH